MDQAPSNRIEDLVRERARLDAELERCRELVTVLFVDIVDSTRFYNDHGDVAGLVMVRKCLELLMPPIQQRQGTVIKTLGDAILARFGDGEAAVRCAVEMQRSVADRNRGRAPNDEIHVRVAINLGLALLMGNDVFGDVVNVASRIESATERDEILISPSVFEKIQHLSDIPVRKKAAGVELKGKQGKLDLYSVAWRPQETAGPAPPRPSNEQLAIATGLHTNLVELAQRGGAKLAGGISRARPATDSPNKTLVFGSAPIEEPLPERPRFTIARVFPDGSLGARYPLDRPGMIAGQQGEICLVDDPSVAAQHARFTQLGSGVYVEDLGSPQGVYLRLREPYRLKNGDAIRIGGQKFRFITEATESPAGSNASANGTALFPGSPATGLSISSLVSLDPSDQENGRFVLQTAETSFGRSKGTHIFPDDLFMSSSHARIMVQGGEYFVDDLGSTNGTFVRIRKRTLAREGDTVMVGGQLLRILGSSAT
jgi:class 3 adenylate cyclase/pSer/pThr/pTyr-binding forkhead associated (FHA) protein